MTETAQSWNRGDRHTESGEWVCVCVGGGGAQNKNKTKLREWDFSSIAKKGVN